MGTDTAGRNARRGTQIKMRDAGIFAECMGTGPGLPLLFLHADLGNHRQWQGIMGALAADRRVIAFDRRGHGASAMPKDGYGYALERADMDAVSAAAGLDRFVCVGHSGGAAAAFLYAQMSPQRIAGLFLVDPAQSGKAMPQEQLRQTIERTRSEPHKSAEAFYRSIAGDAAGVVEQVLSDVRSTDARTIIGMTEALAAFDPAAADRRFEGDALVVQQSRSDTPHAIARIAGYPQVHVDGAGHWIHLARPGRVEELLRQWLEKIGA
jgi:pimeloyl-ACP methyl ester carboxylesterase